MTNESQIWSATTFPSFLSRMLSSKSVNVRIEYETYTDFLCWFPDLIHAVKPRPDNEIPQAATAHDSAWDFFSQQPSSMHTLFWAMSGHGTPRSYRHMDGWGVHTFRLVTEEGKTKLVKFRLKTQQGLASRLWEEQQVLAGKNADADRQDLFEAIENEFYPEWEVSDPTIPTIRGAY
jgi:catalase